MKQLILRLIYNIPKYHNNVWYNQTVWIKEKQYPIIIDGQRYIDCKVGLKVIMGKTKRGKDIYYEVVKMWRTPGGDYIYASDAINCKLKFSHLK